jgi:hypothetical protein
MLALGNDRGKGEERIITEDVHVSFLMGRIESRKTRDQDPHEKHP